MFNNHKKNIIVGWEEERKAEDAAAVLFKRLYGVKPDTFNHILEILQRAFDVLYKNGGKPPKLTPEDKLYVTLKYLREYRTIAADYGVCCLAIQWVEDTLVQDGTFALPEKKYSRGNQRQFSMLW